MDLMGGILWNTPHPFFFSILHLWKTGIVVHSVNDVQAILGNVGNSPPGESPAAGRKITFLLTRDIVWRNLS